MKLTKILLIASIPILTISGLAQQPESRKLTCPTTDGTVIITSSGISLRDYSFTFDKIISSGVVQLVDQKSQVRAVLDTRSDEGLYLAITEGEITMQVVASRKTISFDKINPDVHRPSSPGSEETFSGNLIDLSRTRP